MHRRIFTLVAACVFPVASVSMADDKSIPQSATKEASSLTASISKTAKDHFASDAVVRLDSDEKRIRVVFSKLVKEYGVKNRLEIAQAMSTLVPEELHGYVAKRALYYSPLKAKEILAALSNNGANSSVSSALGALPAVSGHTSDAAEAVGVSFDQSERVFQLPQGSTLRRYVASGFPGGGNGPINGGGTFDPGGGNPAVNVGFALQPVFDNGFTSNGLGYRVTNTNTGELIGDYLVFNQVGNTIELSFKNERNTGDAAADDLFNGSGPPSLVIQLP